LLLIDEGDDERSVTCASAMLRVVD
jgi:hypothetical protein